MQTHPFLRTWFSFIVAVGKRDRSEGYSAAFTRLSSSGHFTAKK
ncbi:hypothetical protein Pvag_pPag10025 (plasmid) [Pantoea vagans C9-1]|jgi:hypothetical protein|nr:hypothetical protein Pvag_pPag10025 [Pantoea vagans C9-1]